VAQGFSPYWYYQGVERLGLVALTEAASKAVATVLLFLLVTGSADGPLVLAIYAIPALAWSAWTNRRIYRTVTFHGLALAPGVRMLRETASFFVFRAAHGTYVAANSFILGALSVPQAVAYFGGAERVIRGAINLIHPVTQAVYPRMSSLVGRDSSKAARLMTLNLILVGGFGVLLGLAAGLGAPLLVRVLLGPGYEASVAVLRVLSLLPPVIAVGTVLGLQWALPFGHERPYFRLVVAGAVLNLTMAVVLAPRFGALGMAGAVLGAEVFVTTGLMILFARKGAGLWRAPEHRGSGGAMVDRTGDAPSRVVGTETRGGR
jgi:polysaccharide transporter, PST family